MVVDDFVSFVSLFLVVSIILVTKWSGILSKLSDFVWHQKNKIVGYWLDKAICKWLNSQGHVELEPRSNNDGYQTQPLYWA